MYRVFSRSPLVYITAFVFVLTVSLIEPTFSAAKESSFQTLFDWLLNPVVLFIILLLFNIWLLTSSVLPIIKIDSYGVKAYSIFWRRKLAWEEIKAAGLFLCKSQLKATRWSHVSFERTKAPQQVSPFQNKGIKINTFVVISSQTIKPKANLTLSLHLFSHSQIATRNEIAFEFEPSAWKAIQTTIDKT
jgi:hypothetical protein